MARLRRVGMLVMLALLSLSAQRSSCAPQSVDLQGQVCRCLLQNRWTATALLERCLTAPFLLQVAELLKLQQCSPDGVIKMDTAEWNKHVGGRSRPFSLVVFSSAAHLLDKPNLRLRELRAEFGYAAKGYRADAGTHGKVQPCWRPLLRRDRTRFDSKGFDRPPSPVILGAQLQVFLVEIEYMRTAEVFSRLPTKSLPYIFHVPPHFNLEGDGVLKVLPRDVMQGRLYAHMYGHAGAIGTHQTCTLHRLL